MDPIYYCMPLNEACFILDILARNWSLLNWFILLWEQDYQLKYRLCKCKVEKESSMVFCSLLLIIITYKLALSQNHYFWHKSIYLYLRQRKNNLTDQCLWFCSLAFGWHLHEPITVNGEGVQSIVKFKPPPHASLLPKNKALHSVRNTKMAIITTFKHVCEFK